MSMWNYVVTAIKPTAVTHSCVGNFTSPLDRNLIIAKCTYIEIHLFTPADGLQLMFDFPIYGRIAILELFRPRGEAQDFLIIVTERYKFCVLQWDAEAFEPRTRKMGDVSDCIGCPTDIGQIGIIDPECRLIGLHLYVGLFKVIPFDSKGRLKEAFDIRLKNLQVLDIKFLYGCHKPTIVVLYQGKNAARHIKTYEVALMDKVFTKGPWKKRNLDHGASLLIPVPMPLGGLIIVGEETIVYTNGNVMKFVQFKPLMSIQPTSKPYGRVDGDGSRYLLGDHAGRLYSLDIIHKKDKVRKLKVEELGVISIASTISYLDSDFVYIGSSYGDSQLGKLNSHLDGKRPYVEVLERYVNLGPIVDFCVVDLDGQCHVQVVTCSGAYKDGSLRDIRTGMHINELASTELQGIKAMWSLRSSTDGTYDSFLVVSFVNATRIFAINSNCDLIETEIEGFNSLTETLFCKGVVHNQLVQVTAECILLMKSTGELENEWKAPDFSINVATASSSQVLVAYGGGHLVHLEIWDGVLAEIKHRQLDSDISCLDINPAVENLNHSTFAAVGMWDMSVRIFTLSNFQEMANVHPGRGFIPRSVLLCVFEGVQYLLCALGNGHVFNFRLNVETGELGDQKERSLGTLPISLRAFSFKNRTLVFAASDRPTIIYSSNKELFYNSDVNLKDLSNICPLNIAAFPDSLAIATEGKLTIGTINSTQKLHRRSITLGEHARRIAHQEQSRTFAICSYRCRLSANSDEVEKHFVRLLDDQTFDIMSSYSLNTFEYGCSILSCSFADDLNMYYCVGTSYVLNEENEENESLKGRILVFSVKDRKLHLVAAKITVGSVDSLISFKGKLLAVENQEIKLYRWMSQQDGTRVLHYECGHCCRKLSLYVQTRGDYIVVGDFRKSVSLLMYKHEERKIKELARDDNPNRMTAVEILDDDIYLGAENNFNLFTVRNNGGQRLEVVGEYHLGQFVNRFRHGSLMCLPDADTDRIPTVIFGTVSGMIGILASLPYDKYVILEKLQSHLTEVLKGQGRLSHDEWRSFVNERKTSGAKNFLDGDLIECFVNLSHEQMSDISTAMGLSVEDLYERVQELRRLH